MQRRKLEELSLMDDFLFNAMLTHPETGEKFTNKILKLLFNREFKNLRVSAQKVYAGMNTDLRGARLDVCIEGDCVSIEGDEIPSVYDVEPDQNNKAKDIAAFPRRSRFYHAIIDSRSLKSGEDFGKLKQVYVIFICNYDPFGYDRVLYTIKNRCLEEPEMNYDDGAETIVLYTRTRDEIERLIAGDEIVKEIHQELTYNELDSSIENLWSVLFTTGYLTQRGRVGEDQYRIAIPNREIRKLFIKQIWEWFRDVSRKDGETLNQFCEAFPEQNPEKIEEIFSDYLWNTISIRDTASSKRENFYHGILLGLLGYKSNWLVKSNAESGIGYSDILVEVPKNRTGIVIELKYAEDGNMDAACKVALQQIEDRDYVAKLKDDGMRNIIKYGIACYKKNCKVVLS